MPLLKSLANNHNEPPMGPPKGFDQEDDDLIYMHISDDRSSVSSYDYEEPVPKLSSNQSPSANRLTKHLKPIHCEEGLPSLAPGRIGSPSQTIAGQVNPNRPVTYGHDVPGIPVRVLVLGAAISAVPGTQIISSIHTVVASTASRTTSAVRKVSQLSKSMMGVRVRDTRDAGDISQGWVEIDDGDDDGDTQGITEPETN